MMAALDGELEAAERAEHRQDQHRHRPAYDVALRDGTHLGKIAEPGLPAHTRGAAHQRVERNHRSPLLGGDDLVQVRLPDGPHDARGSHHHEVEGHGQVKRTGQPDPYGRRRLYAGPACRPARRWGSRKAPCFLQTRRWQ